MTSTYNQHPKVSIQGSLFTGWGTLINTLKQALQISNTLVVDCYSGVRDQEVQAELVRIQPALFIETKDLFISSEAVVDLTARFITDDVLFGYNSNIQLVEYFDPIKLQKAKAAILAAQGLIIIYGPGAQLVADTGVLVYADMPRWEIQMRMRANEAPSLGLEASDMPFASQYKRGLFNDWRVLDKHKQSLYEKVDFWLDTVIPNQPKMMDQATFFRGMDTAASRPFRVVPFFDPAPWGGQWMRKQFGLDSAKVNFGWGFDCVPEENSLLLDVAGQVFEMPAANLVYTRSKQLLGESVEARFGKDFPIRFDFLDTVGGGNLSLQVHPTTQYARDAFGLPYTQDESYYIMHAEQDAEVYLGFKEGVNAETVIDELEQAAQGKGIFDADRYVNKFPAKKHDHFLIPAGTIHCSGKNTVVLEISSTPNLFTFKLWDWERLGLDGKPRPINVQRGKEVLNWECDTAYAEKHLVNHISVIAEGEGYVVEKTGLHTSQFINTYRHTFTVPVLHDTEGSVNVLNLVEGDEIIIESPTQSFSPMIVRYAETCIIPAHVRTYSIRPHGLSEGETCITMKASVKI